MANKYGFHPQTAAEQIAGKLTKRKKFHKIMVYICYIIIGTSIPCGLGFFVELGADKVTMGTLGEDFSLLESQKEFLRAFESNRHTLPILTGICPGMSTFS